MAISYLTDDLYYIIHTFNECMDNIDIISLNWCRASLDYFCKNI